MITRVSLSLIIPFVIFAIFLFLNGVVSLSGNDYYSLIQDISNNARNWDFQIPNIPNIPFLPFNDISNVGSFILDVLKGFVNYFVLGFNAIITALNVWVLIFNVIIKVIQFVVSFILVIGNFISSRSNSLFLIN